MSLETIVAEMRQLNIGSIRLEGSAVDVHYNIFDTAVKNIVEEQKQETIAPDIATMINTIKAASIVSETDNDDAQSILEPQVRPLTIEEYVTTYKDYDHSKGFYVPGKMIAECGGCKREVITDSFQAMRRGENADMYAEYFKAVLTKFGRLKYFVDIDALILFREELENVRPNDGRITRIVPQLEEFKNKLEAYLKTDRPSIERKYKHVDDSEQLFLSNCVEAVEPADDGSLRSVKENLTSIELFRAYRNYCEVNKLLPVQVRSFKTTLTELMPYMFQRKLVNDIYRGARNHRGYYAVRLIEPRQKVDVAKTDTNN